VVAVILIIGLPRLFGSKSATDNTTGNGRPADASLQPTETYAGTLNELTIDDSFKASLTTAIRLGNSGWKNEGTDAFVYRFSIGNNVVAATSQVINIALYVGGEDAKKAVDAPGDIAFNLGAANFFDSMNSRAGVRLSPRLLSTNGSDVPDKYDEYVRYGYYYGLEHIKDIQPIIDALEGYYKENGEYPHILKTNLISKGIKTRQGFYFMADGFGYLPVFKTDVNGDIVMGTGAGLDSLNPDQCTGYYLFKYVKEKTMGLDIHNKENEHYYQQKISPFPYDSKEGIKNIILTPDGEPDGIACVVKDGILLDQ